MSASFNEEKAGKWSSAKLTLQMVVVEICEVEMCSKSSKLFLYNTNNLLNFITWMNILTEIYESNNGISKVLTDIYCLQINYF